MKSIVISTFLFFFLGACASQGQKGAEIEQRDLFEQQEQAKRQQEADRQAQVAREQEELKRQLDEQQRRQQELTQQQEQPIVRPLPGTGVGQTPLGAEPWAQLKETGSLLGKRSVYYDFDSYAIKEEFVPVVEAHARFLMSHADLKIAVQGNCDDRGSREYNLALGQRRADSVRRAMVLLGVNDRQIETVSFGAEKPVAFGQDETSWAQNRRSDIVYPGEPQ